MHCPAKRFAAANATAFENDAVNLQPRFARLETQLIHQVRSAAMLTAASKLRASLS